MTSADQPFTDLFRDYAAASLHAEPARLAAFYAASFIVAGPTGSAAFPNDERFLDWLRQLHAFNRRVGMTSLAPVSLGDPLLLSERHVLVRVQWGARFEKTGDQPVTFWIAYLLERSPDGWKILAYVSEKDQDQEMQALGLL